MKNIKLNSKGVAGLDLVLSVITIIFVIGLLVMIYALMGGALSTASYDTTSVSAVNESVTSSKSAGLSATLVGGTKRDGSCSAITVVYNGTVDSKVIALGNFTQTGCTVVNASSMATWHTALLFSYPYTWSADNTATNIMNDTVNGIADVPDWFPIVIVITFMVVLVLLTVMIVRAVRGSGLMGGEIGA